MGTSLVNNRQTGDEWQAQTRTSAASQADHQVEVARVVLAFLN